jgi:hypothetical protein
MTKMSRRVLAELASACAAVGLFGFSTWSAYAHASTVLDFEDFYPETLDIISDGYAGFEWRAVDEVSNFNMGFYSPSLRSECSTTGGVFAGGYCNGTVSGDFVAFRGTANQFGPATIRRSEDFNALSVFVTSPWNDGADLVVRGLSNGVELYREDFIISTSVASFLQLNYLGIDTVTFQATGGVNAGYGSSGEGVVIDDFTYSEVSLIPIPASFWLWVVGLGVMGYYNSRQQKSLMN